MIEERNGVRRTKGWNGVGKMVGVGEHLDRKGDHCKFVIKPKLRKKWSNEAEKTILNKCGSVFKNILEKNQSDIRRCYSSKGNFGQLTFPMS